MAKAMEMEMVIIKTRAKTINRDKLQSYLYNRAGCSSRVTRVESKLGSFVQNQERKAHYVCLKV